MTKRAKVNLESAMSTAKAVGSNHFAKALVLGIENPGQNDRPLTENQRCDVAAMILMSYADFVADMRIGLEGDAALEELTRMR